jgi:dienelactone hydrolase
MRHPIKAFLLAVAVVLARADGPADNVADKVRRIPPPGIAIPEDARRELTEGAAQLAGEIDALRGALTNRPALLARLPDVQVLHKAVDWALRHDEFFRTNEVKAARERLDEARRRLAALREGRTPWLEKAGPVALGYVSRIDGSVQPFGLVIPEGFAAGASHRWRLDFWFHGRGEQLSELAFVQDRTRNKGEFTPANAFVLHPYGRYCNGSRFAGETDAWEALEEVKRLFPIDEDRLVVRGFSLGGASCWHFAVHHAWKWAAAAPGAGFSETAEFLKVFQNEKLTPAPWEQKLWALHDATANALNVSMVPLVAYSGEIDRQKQAADVMAAALEKEGMELTHIIGPKTAHSYEQGAKAEINRRIDALAALGREALPKAVRFTTPSLRYNRMAWVTVDALGAHWEPARVDATLRADGDNLVASTHNVTAITFQLPPGLAPFDVRSGIMVELDGNRIKMGPPQTDRSWRAAFHREGANWVAGPLPSGLRKRHGLQGPIDDAFMDSFLFVRPTGQPLNAAVGNWVANELAHAVEHWRRHYRGDVRIKDDTAVNDEDIAGSHLVLWGDPKGNSQLARIADKLGIRWDANGVRTPAAGYPVNRYVPAFVYPNPLNPERYVVVNSGFTFREYDYLNNARQTPKLPDWAILDIAQPMTARAPAGITAAGFFGEQWEWKP